MWQTALTCECTCSHSLPCNGKKQFFIDRIVRSAKAALVSLIVKQICIPWAIPNFLNSPANSVPSSTQSFLGRSSSEIMLENVLTVSLESFVFNPFASLFDRTSLEELVNTLHHCFLYQFVRKIHTTNFFFEAGKSLHSLEFSCSQSKFCEQNL